MMDTIIYSVLGFTAVLVSLELLYLAYLRYQKSRHRWGIHARMIALEENDSTDSGVVLNIDGDRRIDVPEPIVMEKLEEKDTDNLVNDSNPVDNTQVICNNQEQGKFGVELSKSNSMLKPSSLSSSVSFRDFFNSNSLWNLTIGNISCITNSFIIPGLQAKRMRSILFSHLNRALEKPCERIEKPRVKYIELSPSTPESTLVQSKTIDMKQSMLSIDKDEIEINNNIKTEPSIEFDFVSDTSSAKFQVHTGSVRWLK